jgi:hypothetical protein
MLQKEKGKGRYDKNLQSAWGKIGGAKAAIMHQKNGTTFFCSDFQSKMAQRGGSAGKGLLFWYNIKTHEAVRKKECPGEDWIRGRGSDKTRREASVVKYLQRSV